MKKLFISLLLCILLCGCSKKTKQNDGIERLYLDSSYYNLGDYIDIDSDDLNNISGNYLLFTYNNYCNFSVPCDEIFKVFMEKYKIDILSIPFDEFKKKSFYETVKYAPSIIIVEDGAIKAYLDAESDDDIKKYTNSDEFEKWLNNYISFTRKKNI